MNDAVLLISAAFFTSVISGTIGMIGGILLLTIMAEFFAPQVLIPLHGIVQFGSNAFRVVLSFRALRKEIVLPFLFGAVFGAVAGSQIVVGIPENTFRVILGCFILVMAWLPKFKKAPVFPGKWAVLGGVATFISLFVGATGPFLAPFFLRENLKKLEIVICKAGCQTVVHTFKVATFFLLGFSATPYLGLLVGMLIAVLVGNYVGKQFLGKIPEKLFRTIFKGVLSVLAIRMVYLTLR